MDSRPTHHLTNNMQALTEGKPYIGSQLLLVGNGQGLTITHTCCTCLHTSLRIHLNLTNVLCVPNIAKNFISISKLIIDNNIIIEFSFNICFIKDKMKRALLAQGIVEGGLYKLLSKDSPLHHSKGCTHKPSFMMSILFNNKVINPLHESNNQISVNLTCHGSVSASFLTLGSELIKLLHNRFGHLNKHGL